MSTDYAKWRANSSVQYDLRQSGTKTILMKRTADENGWDERGKPQTWLDVATFDRNDEAIIVLAALNRDKEAGQIAAAAAAYAAKIDEPDGQAQPT